MIEKVDIMALKDESLEDFISSFNLYEAEAGVFELRDKENYPWWDLVRYRVQFALCVERGFYRDTKSLTPPPLLTRAQSFARQMLRLLLDIKRLSGNQIRQVRTLIISKRSLDYADNLAVSEAEHGNSVLFINKSGDALTPHMAITSQSIEFFTRLTHLTQRLPLEVEQETRRLAHDIRKRFESRLDIFAIIATKYREEMIARCLWSFILDRAGTLERVVFVNDDTLKSLVLLSRTRGLVTEEVQHAYMGKGHIGFSYPPLDATPNTLPHRVILSRDTGDITYPVQRLVLKSRRKLCPLVARDIDVLIGSSPTRQKEASDIAMVLHRHGLTVAVKLHPAESRQSWKSANCYYHENMIIYNGSVNIHDLANRAKLFIPANPDSTAAFEAAEMGSLVLLVHLGGVKRSAACDSVASAHAYSLENLPLAVELQLAAIQDNFQSNEGECN